ncbi:MAG TPA: ATP-binding cassette domain-containing protein, partial [Candidatus Synoicihabitans sp.]|nr:ATP-binding cassette domain-containing protein [Candidatus Synoicihabitans sp.]
MPSTPILAVDHVRVQRGAVRLLDEVSWRVQAGEHWVVLGANGSGKTSLLRVLMGFLSPSAGEIDVLGHRYGATDWREVRPAIGLVSSALHAHIPGGEPAEETVISGRYAQLDFWGEATAADRSTARRALRQMNAAMLADRPWAWLSQGERQRVLIARALVA